MRELGEEHAPDERAAEQLGRRLVPERGLGAAGVRRARHRAAVGRSSSSACGSTRTTPSPPGGHTSPSSAQRADHAQRAARSTRCASTAAGTDLTVGLLPESRWLGSESRPLRRPPLRREHADRGGLHDSGLPPHRGRRPLDAAAAALRQRSCGGSSCASRTAASSTSGRGRRDVVDGELATRRARAVPRRGRARRRRRRASARPDLCSSTRSSTRTRRATSPTARATPRRSRAASSRARTSSTVHTDLMIGGPEVDVDACCSDGTVVPLLRDDVWQLDRTRRRGSVQPPLGV